MKSDFKKTVARDKSLEPLTNFLKAQHPIQLKLALPGKDLPTEDTGNVSAGKNLIAGLKKLTQTMRDAEAENARTIEASGQKIFRVLTQNDDISVEADYGAPSIGLNFAHRLIDFNKAYRYPRIRTVEAESKTFHESAMKVGQFLKRQGYGIFKNLTVDEYPSQIMFVNGGVTNAFNKLVEHLIAFHEKFNEVRKDVDGAKKGAILVPVPTYGLFLYLLDELTENRDIEIIPVQRFENGAVFPASLQRAIEECNQKDMRIIAYYDCNPNNPTGHVRGRAETQAVADIIHSYNKKLLQNFEEMYKTRELPNPFILTSVHPVARIMMIDDMAYEGLEYDPKNKPVSFSQLSPEIAEQSVTLKGISKIGLPGARIGLMIGHNEIIGRLSGSQLTSEFCASSFGVDIITARYSDSEHQAEFTRHKTKLRQKHKHNSGVLEALFQGLNSSCGLNAQEKDRIVGNYAQHGNIAEDKARELLDKGLPKFYIYPDTQCGFFKMVNFDALREKIIHIRTDDDYRVYSAEINSGHTMWYMLKGFGIDVVPVSWAGAGPGCLNARITLSLKDEEIFTMYDRLREVQDYFFGPDPDVQLDYLRMPKFNTNIPAFP